MKSILIKASLSKRKVRPKSQKALDLVIIFLQIRHQNKAKHDNIDHDGSTDSLTEDQIMGKELFQKNRWEGG